MPASPAWWLRLVRLGGCYLLGLIAVGLLLVALLMTGQFRVVALWQASGLPLALLLERLPGEFWQALLGLPLHSEPWPCVRCCSFCWPTRSWPACRQGCVTGCGIGDEWPARRAPAGSPPGLLASLALAGCDQRRGMPLRTVRQASSAGLGVA